MRFLVTTLIYACKVCAGWFVATALWAHPVEIQMWHAMAGPLGVEINHLAKAFNASQTHYTLKPIYKGNYAETLTAFAAAYRAHAAPALLQVFEVGSTTMLYPEGVIKPVGRLLKEQHSAIKLNQSAWPVLRQYYSQKGEWVAFPLNVSLPIMYYNADRLKALGYTAETFPKTWDEFETLLTRLHQAGDRCAYTSAYPTWIHIESFLALHGLAKGVRYDYPALRAHLTRLVRWHKTHLFEYAGRLDEATILFTSGRCALFSQSSGAYRSLMQTASFQVGIASIPFDAHYTHKRFPNVVGGGALWVVAGQSSSVEAGIAQWLQFLAQPAIQQKWYQKTGYLPILKQTNPTGLLALVNTEWAVSEEDAKASFMQAQHRVRVMNDETMEALFAGLVTVDDMLQRMSDTTTYALSRFIKNHGLV